MRLGTKCAVVLCLIFCAGSLTAQTPSTPASSQHQAEVVFVENQAEVLRSGSKTWDSAPTNAPYNVLNNGDQLRTLANSRAGLRLPGGQGTFVLGPFSYFALPEHPGPQATIQILKGRLFNFHRGPPGEILFQTPTVSAIVRGTEFLLNVDDDGSTTVNMFNGEVEMENSSGTITLTNGETGVARPGQAPAHTAVITSVNLIQWCLYYPAVLSLSDLPAGDLGHDLGDSLAVYRSGDLIGALQAFPAGRSPANDSEKVYYAELLLSVGNVNEAERILKPFASATHSEIGTTSVSRLAAALQRLIAVVKTPTKAATLGGGETNKFSATEWMVASYDLQSQFRLEAALIAARNATKQAPDFGFAWARVAELEFGFGRTEAAQSALRESLRLSPLNPEALALQGFLLAAQNKTREAAAAFERAIALDGSLGNAWLGRGLCEMRLGHTRNALKDLEVAAAVEPQRALFRSYLAKVFGTAGSNSLADREIALAKQLDPADPTAWLYSALLKQQQNQINDAIEELTTAQDKNDNRSLFRSRLLLDQDRAVEGANLASVYRDAGMTDVSVREAAAAVNDDYANASAHLFLSDAYNDLRDPTQFNLRYETVWFNELLLANLLSPVGGGRLSQTVSQQEYSKLFQQDGFGLANSTDVRSDGMYHQQSSQYGTFGNTEYALDLDYHHNNGVRVNNRLDDLEWDTTIKQQVTPRDTALLLMQYQNYHSGDNFQYYDASNPFYYPFNARPNYEFTEYQHPILVGGWDHEWAPGIRTLGLVSRLTDEQYFSDQAAPQTVLVELSNGSVNSVFAQPYNVTYHNQFDIYSAELNQICEWDHVTVSAGARYQSGSFQAQDQFNISNPNLASLYTPTANAINENFERITGYGYLTVEPLENFRLTGGLTYDDVTYPDNYRQAPVNSGQDEHSQLGPKAVLVWTPIQQVTLRGVYTRSLGGVDLDESYRLEPTELAGFPQTFRSLISESLVSSVSAPGYETWGGALDLKLGPRTFAGIQGERLTTYVQRNDGVFVLQNGVSPGSTPETLNYSEYDLSVSLNQLVGSEFVLGASYGATWSDLHDVLTDIPVSALATANQNEQSMLQQAETYVQFNHPSGFFARAEAHWYGQSNTGWTPAEPGDDFFQENLFVGCYFAHHRGKLQLGILNLGGGNYNLNPLTPYQELPRSRVYEGSVNFLF